MTLRFTRMENIQFFLFTAMGLSSLMLLAMSNEDGSAVDGLVMYILGGEVERGLDEGWTRFGALSEATKCSEYCAFSAVGFSARRFGANNPFRCHFARR